MPELAETVVYVDRKGHGTERAAIVIMTPDQNYTPPTEDEMATLAKFELSPPRPPRHRPLDAGEVLLKVMTPGRDYTKRAVEVPGGVFLAAPDPEPETPVSEGLLDI